MFEKYLFASPDVWNASNASNASTDSSASNEPDLWDTIENNMHQPWDWRKLSYHSPMNWEFLDRHIHHSWDWSHLSTTVPFWLVMNHRDKDWRVSLTTLLLRNNDWSEGESVIQVVKENPCIWDVWNAWDWSHLTLHVSLEDIEDNIDMSWDWSVLHSHRQFNKSLLTKYPLKKWCWRSIGFETLWYMVDEMKDVSFDALDWDTILSVEPMTANAVTVNAVTVNASQSSSADAKKSASTKLKWAIFAKRAPDHVCLKYSGMIPSEYIHEIIELEKSLDYEIIVPTVDLIKTYPDKPWAAYKMIEKQVKQGRPFHWKHIWKWPHLDWGWKHVLPKALMSSSKETQIHWRLVPAFPEKPWDWRLITEGLSRQDRWDIISMKHLRGYIVWSILKPSRAIAEQYWWCPWQKMAFYSRNAAAIIIQKWWMDQYYNPSNNVCKRRLCRELEELVH